MVAVHILVGASLLLMFPVCSWQKKPPSHPAAPPPDPAVPPPDPAVPPAPQDSEIHAVLDPEHSPHKEHRVQNEEFLMDGVIVQVKRMENQDFDAKDMTDDVRTVEDLLAALDPLNGQTADKRRGKAEPEVSTGKSRRTKRSVFLKDETYQWTNGIIPYVFDSSLTEFDKLSALYSMEFLSNHSCIRYVPWDDTTKDTYGLASNGRLKFITSGQCWSYIGNLYFAFEEEGQNIGCCYPYACIHELSHALGFDHEQNHYYNKGWLRVNLFDMDMKVNGYNYNNFVKKASGSRRFGPYDRNSPMHYPVSDYYVAMTSMFPELTGNEEEFHLFFQAVSELYKCKERYCVDFSVECANGGFVTTVKGECACLCPPGLDPASGCTIARTKFEAYTFPGHSYSFPAPAEGCPVGHGFLTDGAVTHGYPSVSVQEPYMLLGRVANGTAETRFCVKNSTNDNRVAWPRGLYCIYRVGICPPGFYISNITIGTDDTGSNVISGATPDVIVTDNFVQFHFCCRNEGRLMIPVDFPNTQPFVLVQQDSAGCQQINGMRVHRGRYSLTDPKTGNYYSASADGPYLERESDGVTKLYYCYYYPVSDHPFTKLPCEDSQQNCSELAGTAGQCDVDSVRSLCPYSCNACPGPSGNGACVDTDDDCAVESCHSYAPAKLNNCAFTCRQCDEFCGGVIHLTNTRRSQIIVSPNYPQNYSNSMDCYWHFRSPPDSFLLLRFNDFDVEGSEEECVDSVEINYGYLGQAGLKYCGRGMQETIHSINNTIEVKFKTSFMNTRKGFNATVSVVLPEDHCFDQSQLGRNYRGTVSFTHRWETCLPWTEVTHCRHHAFAPWDVFDGLDSNYCRNPGDGVRPWCYYDANKCRRNYCDVCGQETPYDTDVDCDSYKSSTNCSDVDEAREKCAKTCQDLLPTQQTTVATDIQCSAPSEPPPDGTATTSTEGAFQLGDNITYTCNTDSNFSRVTICLSDGSWSPIGYVCGGCPDGWTFYGNHCYLPSTTDGSYVGAVQHCASLGAVLAEARNEDIARFLVQLRDDGILQWIGLRRAEGSTTYLWQGETEPTCLNLYSSTNPGEGYSILQPDVSVDIVSTNYYLNNTYVCQRPPQAFTTCADLLPESECASKIAQSPTVCEDQPHFAKLMCPKSCYGNCQDPCSSSPCQNGGTCRVLGGTYTCSCIRSYTGVNCEGTATATDSEEYCQVYAGRGDCANDRMHYVLSVCPNECETCHYDTCEDLDSDCSSATHWYPSTCVTDYDYISVHCRRSCGFCRHADLCADRSSNCTAMKDQCNQPDVKAQCPHTCNLCYNPACRDHAMDCSEKASKGGCASDPDYMTGNCTKSCGKCQELDACYSQPCLHGGTCAATSTGYCCSCTADYWGMNCEDPLDGPCASMPCQNGGWCNAVSPNATYINCTCPEGYGGTTCQLTDPCDSNPCQNGGACDGDIESGTFTCSCVSGYQGETCDECVNHDDNCDYWQSLGFCAQDGDFYSYMMETCQYSCVCDPCLSGPCQNGGTCNSEGESYTCSCTASHAGDHCTEEVYDPCESTPCGIGGTCNPNTDTGTFTCSCFAGYRGNTCDECYDVNVSGNCDYWTEMGFCGEDSNFHSFMADNCRLTCSLCG